jgi:hypothetical protein
MIAWVIGLGEIKFISILKIQVQFNEFELLGVKYNETNQAF